jgi:hypothetical protein
LLRVEIRDLRAQVSRYEFPRNHARQRGFSHAALLGHHADDICHLVVLPPATEIVMNSFCHVFMLATKKQYLLFVKHACMR